MLKVHSDGENGLSSPPYHGRTDGDGRFVAESVEPGETRLAVRARGFASHESFIDVEPGEATDVEVRLDRAGILAGRITSAKDEPIFKARVLVGDGREFLTIKAYTEKDGTYELRGVRPGDVEIFAQFVMIEVGNSTHEVVNDVPTRRQPSQYVALQAIERHDLIGAVTAKIQCVRRIGLYDNPVRLPRSVRRWARSREQAGSPFVETRCGASLR